MKLKFITIGTPKLPFAKAGVAEYAKRLKALHDLELIHLKDSVKEDKILQQIGDSFCVVLDENGIEFDSKGLAEFLEQKSLLGIQLCFVIGGPDGHSKRIKERANHLWSLSKMTFPHDLAMVMTLEALYRASTINIGHPYHRE